MYLSLYFLGAFVLLSIGGLVGWWISRRFRQYRGQMVLSCPETKAPVVVELNASRAVLTETIGNPSLRLETCTRWPERADCGQDCLCQVDPTDPHASLVIARLARWYKGRTCVVCDREFQDIEADAHRPALLAPDGATISIDDIPAESVESALDNHLPVCWRCHVAESFRRTHPELVTDSFVASN